MMTKEEFEKSLIAPVQFWYEKPREAVCMLLGEDVANMVGFNQRNPHHCYDLFMHSLHTVAGITETAPALLRVAAFFHDIGKLYVAEEKQGRLVFYGHAQKSAKIAEPILNQLGYSVEEREEVCFYISHHDDFISFKVAPVSLAVSYQQLYNYVSEGNIGSTLFLIRDVFELMIKIPIGILLDGIYKMLDQSDDVDQLLNDHPKFKQLYGNGLQILTTGKWWECVRLATYTVNH